MMSIYSCNLEMVLSRLRLDKCRFLQERVNYLGHTIDAQGMHTSGDKVKAIVEAPSPTNLPELRSFLGLLNYYAKFLPNLASVLHLLHWLLRGNQQWKWTDECEAAFQQAKKDLVDAPVLAFYDPDLPLILKLWLRGSHLTPNA